MNGELSKVKLSEYTPLEDEEYMNAKQLKYFELKLKSMLAELEEQGIIDEEDKFIERRKEKKEEIKAALEKIELGTYGYCEATWEEIGIERLEANPLAKHCIEEQERIEKESIPGNP